MPRLRLAAGALDLTSCPKRDKRGRCLCGLCVICMLPKHSRPHGPHYGGEEGSVPLGHEYQETPWVEARSLGEDGG